jgi:hypothetical protein
MPQRHTTALRRSPLEVAVVTYVGHRAEESLERTAIGGIEQRSLENLAVLGLRGAAVLRGSTPQASDDLGGDVANDELPHLLSMIAHPLIRASHR